MPDGSEGEIVRVAPVAGSAGSGEGVASADVSVEASAEDGALQGHRAVPARGSGPGVLVLGNEPGLDDFTRQACGRLARAGFVALAVPWGGGEPERVLARGVRALLGDVALTGSRIGALGFGAGGLTALRFASGERHIAAIVSVDGVPAGDDVAGPLPPTLLVFGAADAGVAAAARAFSAREPSVHLHAEPGISAGFVDERRADRHVALAAARAWDAAFAFLRAAA